MSSVRAWCMAVCCVCDGRWRRWMSSVRAWCMAVCVSLMVGGGVVSELGAWPCVVSLMVGGGSG